ncbi:MAG: mannose-1-phosphate guanylyltransferase [Candidatus Omnitrophota bacterium]
MVSGKLHTLNPIPYTPHVYAVILVGGKGKRLRPLSTDRRPKPFLSITGDRKTMFARTLDRARAVVPDENIIVVANEKHAALVRKDLPTAKEADLLFEPVARNTAPAIAWAASVLRARDRDAVMIIMPADHYITDERPYIDAMKRGIEFVRVTRDALMVVGIKPTFPATVYGYVRVNAKGSTVHGPRSTVRGIYKVEKFTEKPVLKTAKKFVKDGRYFWNAGVFVFTAGAVLESFRQSAPAIADAVMDPARVRAVYRRLPDISIDYAVLEKARNIYCVKGSYDWKDIGSFEVLKDVLISESIPFLMCGKKIVKIL